MNNKTSTAVTVCSTWTGNIFFIAEEFKDGPSHIAVKHPDSDRVVRFSKETGFSVLEDMSGFTYRLTTDEDRATLRRQQLQKIILDKLVEFDYDDAWIRLAVPLEKLEQIAAILAQTEVSDAGN